MFHHGLIHVESSYCHSKSDPPTPSPPGEPPGTLTTSPATFHPTGQHIDRRLSFLGPSQSGTVFPKQWPQHHPRVEQPSPRSDHSIIPEWNSLPQEVTTASSQSGTAFPKKWPQHHPRVEQPSPRSDHSIIPEWNSLPQEVTTASSQSGTAFPKKWPQHHPRVEQSSPRSDHSIIPEWNSLPQEVTTAPTPGSFATRVCSLLDP